MLAWQERLDAAGVGFAVTSRRGGVSSPPYDGCNLGDHVGDDPAAVAENRRRVAQAAGMAPDRFVTARQVHGADVVIADGPWDGEAPAADAVVTAQPGLVLGVLVADCTPVLLAAPRERLVAVAHAGRAGLRAGVVPAVLASLRGLGATRVVARVGPSICGRCYEVPHEMAEDVASIIPVARSVTSTGAPSLAIAAGVVAQLAKDCDEVRWLPGCTAEGAEWYSFRRDGRTGRFAGITWLEP